MALLSDSEITEFCKINNINHTISIPTSIKTKPSNSTSLDKIRNVINKKSSQGVEDTNLQKICKALSYSFICKTEYMSNSQSTTKQLYDKCDSCGNDTPMILTEDFYICYKCGRQIKHTLEKHNPNSVTHNISNNALMLFKIIGPDNNRYQKSLLQTSSDYRNYRRGFNIREFKNYNNQSKLQLPINVLVKAAHLFTDIQDAGNIVRADHKLGVRTALIGFECIRANITKKPKFLAAFVGITSKYLSNGQRHVRKWCEDGIISIPTRSNPTCDFIDQYFEMLNIDMKYKSFILNLIDKIKFKRINTQSSSNPSTQVVSIIWLLIIQFNLNISHADVIKFCDISKSTYIAYYKIIISNERHLRKVFFKENIPIPAHWTPFKAKKKRIIHRTITRQISKIPKNI